MRSTRRVSLGLLAFLLVLALSYVSWAASIAEYGGGTEVWGITDISGDFEVFCNSDNILLDVRHLDMLSVIWSELGNEANGVVIRTQGNGSVITDFTLPGT